MPAILRAELREEPLSPEATAALTPDRLPSLYRSAKAQDLAHIVSNRLDTLGLLGEDEISQKLQKQAMIAVFRCERIKYELQAICDALNEAQIPYIPLKGSVIRPYYPQESMRTSTDIDLFLSKEELPHAERVVREGLGYQRSGESFSEISYMSPSGVHLELHFWDGRDSSDDFTVFENVWSHAVCIEKSRYALTDPYFLFYHISHMAKHFRHGGCGIRPFMDLWIIEHKMGIDRHVADAMLAENGLLQFAATSFALCDVWFSDGEHNDLTLSVQSFLLNTGIFGSQETASVAAQIEQGGRLRSLMARIFFPYKKMAFLYPVLRKCPVLLPFCHVHRWISILFRRGSAKKLRTMMSVSDTRRDGLASLFEQLEL